MIFLALTHAPSLPASDARLPLAFWLAEAVTMAVAFGLGRLRRLPRATLGALMIAGVFGNTAFLGYPVTLSLLPGEFPQAVLLDEFGCVIVLYLSGALIGGAFGSHGGDWRGAVLRFARSPLFLSVVAALLVRLLPWPHGLSALPAFAAVGSVLSQCLAYLSQGTTPLILLAVGVSLQPRTVLAAPGAALLPCLLKLIVCPLAMSGACRLLGVGGSASGGRPASLDADQRAGLRPVRAERHGRVSGRGCRLPDDDSGSRQSPPDAFLAALTYIRAV